MDQTRTTLSNITDTDIRKAINSLDEAEVPETDRYLIISPDQKNAISGIEFKFIPAYKISDPSVIREGLHGLIYGVLVYVNKSLQEHTAFMSIPYPDIKQYISILKPFDIRDV